MKDSLVTCKRCQSKLCYEQQIDSNTYTWLCLTCGFTTNTALEEHSEAVDTVRKTAPELYKDLLYIDDKRKVWMPATITVPEKGMVFLDGT